MSFIDSIPQSQTSLAAGIFFATFVYEDGATLLAATLSASGRLDPRLGLLSAFLGIWVGDIGLYGLGSSVGRRLTQWQWLQRVLKAHIARQSRGLVRKTRSVCVGHQPRDPRKPAASLRRRGRVAASAQGVRSGHRCLCGRLGVGNICYLAVCSACIVGLGKG